LSGKRQLSFAVDKWAAGVVHSSNRPVDIHCILATTTKTFEIGSVFDSHGTWSVRDSTASITAMEAVVARLEAKLARLESQNAVLVARVDDLSSRLARVEAGVLPAERGQQQRPRTTGVHATLLLIPEVLIGCIVHFCDHSSQLCLSVACYRARRLSLSYGCRFDSASHNYIFDGELTTEVFTRLPFTTTGLSVNAPNMQFLQKILDGKDLAKLVSLSGTLGTKKELWHDADVAEEALPVASLASICGLTGLVSLELSDYRIDAPHGNATGSLADVAKSFPQLQKVFLDGSKIEGNILTLTNTNLTHISYKNSIGIHGSLSSLKDLSRLTHLHFTNCGVIDGDVSSLAALTDLSSLCLFGCNSVSGNLSSLAALTNVVELELGGCENICGDLSSLGCLGMKRLSIYQLDGIIADFSSFSVFTAITDLDIEYCNNVNGNLSSMSTLTNITKLHLNSLFHVDGDLSSLANSSKISDLDISYCSSIRGNLSSLSHLSNLADLVLVDDFEESSIDGSLVSLTSLPNLRDVNISQVLVTFPGSLEDVPAALNGTTHENCECRCKNRDECEVLFAWLRRQEE